MCAPKSQRSWMINTTFKLLKLVLPVSAVRRGVVSSPAASSVDNPENTVHEVKTHQQKPRQLAEYCQTQTTGSASWSMWLLPWQLLTLQLHEAWLVQMFKLFVWSSWICSCIVPQQTANTLSPFCSTSPSMQSSPRAPLRLAQKDPCLIQEAPLRCAWNNQIDLFHTFTQWKPRQTAHTAGGLNHSALLVETLTLRLITSEFTSVFCVWCSFIRKDCFTYIRPWKSWGSRSSVPALLSVRTLEEEDQPMLMPMVPKNCGAFLKSEPTHWSAVHRGVFSSVALNIHKDHEESHLMFNCVFAICGHLLDFNRKFFYLTNSGFSNCVRC